MFCESRDKDALGDAAAGCGGGAAEAGEVVAEGAGGAFDDSAQAQAVQLAGEGRERELRDMEFQVCPAHAADVEFRSLQGAQQGLLFASGWQCEQVRPREGVISLFCMSLHAERRRERCVWRRRDAMQRDSRARPGRILIIDQ